MSDADLTDAELAELERLENAATPGPWEAYGITDDDILWPIREAGPAGRPMEFVEAELLRFAKPPESFEETCRRFDEAIPAAEDDPEPEDSIVPLDGESIACRRWVACSASALTGDVYGQQEVGLKPRDAALIAAARNALPRLLAELRRRRAGS